MNTSYPIRSSPWYLSSGAIKILYSHDFIVKPPLFVIKGYQGERIFFFFADYKCTIAAFSVNNFLDALPFLLVLNFDRRFFSLKGQFSIFQVYLVKMVSNFVCLAQFHFKRHPLKHLFLGKSLLKFVSSALKLYNLYCHNISNKFSSQFG